MEINTQLNTDLYVINSVILSNDEEGIRFNSRYKNEPLCIDYLTEKETGNIVLGIAGFHPEDYNTLETLITITYKTNFDRWYNDTNSLV